MLNISGREGCKLSHVSVLHYLLVKIFFDCPLNPPPPPPYARLQWFWHKNELNVEGSATEKLK